MNTHAFLYTGFVVLPIVMVALVCWAARSRRLTCAILAWMMISAALALSGILQRFMVIPPPMGVFLLLGFAVTIAVGRSGWVARLIELPWAALIAVHSFRIVVEILIHESSRIGLAPRQMTWDGCNFDVVTGITALALAPFARVAPRPLVFFWNCMGLGLLLWVVGIAAVSFPTPFQLMQPDNTWVASFPYVWLPAILVTAALLGHIIIFRRLARGEMKNTGAV